MMIQLLDQAAKLIGWFVIILLFIYLAFRLWMKFTVETKVSEEAKELAREVDPNNDTIPQATAEVMSQMVLDSIRELQPDETIRAEPGPITFFEWSTTEHQQEDIERVLRVLGQAGYHTHPLPRIEDYEDIAKWDRKRAGVWKDEPKWHIVSFDEETGEREVKEEVEIPVPKEWSPE